MYNSLRQQRAPGMQIHAVPGTERAIDASGRRLPWGYEYSNTANPTSDTDRREPLEKGPFGRSMRRSRSGASRSRSKTAEPRREEDRLRAENVAAEDAIFGSMRRAGGKEDGKRDALGEVDSNAAQQTPAKTPAAVAETDSEPTEVRLNGFGEDLQWAAIDFYERVSNGCILEDYERSPVGQRLDVARTLGRQAAQRNLSRAAMRKKNTYRGGNNWIKVTFDSRQSAELAIARSPHIIKGYLVYAEYFTGGGPQTDEPIFATQAGAQITSDQQPMTFSTVQQDGSPNGSSTTATSATATGVGAAVDGQARTTSAFALPWNAPLAKDSPTASSTATLNGRMQAQDSPATPTPLSSGYRAPVQQRQQLQPRKSKLIEGTKPPTWYGHEVAFAPKQPKASWSSWVGASEVIGSAVPRKEDGSFDWDRASLYWRIFWYLDFLLGTDFCGLKMDD